MKTLITLTHLSFSPIAEGQGLVKAEDALARLVKYCHREFDTFSFYFSRGTAGGDFDDLKEKVSILGGMVENVEQKKGITHFIIKTPQEVKLVLQCWIITKSILTSYP